MISNQTKNSHSRVIAVTGAKGGVGKSVCAVNLALALAKANQRVVIFDANCGLGSVDVLLGIVPTKNIHDVLSGQASLSEILISGHQNIHVVPAALGNRDCARLGVFQSVEIIRAFSEISGQTDCLLVDTESGLGDSVIHFSKAAQEIILVVNNESTALLDTAAFIKCMTEEKGFYKFQLLANMVRDPQEGRKIYEKIAKMTENLQGFSLSLLGSIPFDECVRKSIRRRSPLMVEYPNSAAAQAFIEIAAQIQGWIKPQYGNGNIQFFAEEMIHSRFNQRGTQA